jgi:uncharacterized protein HemX
MPDRPVRIKNETETPNNDPLERNQPDPALRLSSGRLGGGGMAIVAIAIVVIIGLVVYGFRHESTPTQPAPAAAVNSGAPHG